MPTVGYTETTEHIFSSSIETINTVGNVLFTENVAKFYQDRRYFKTMVCDSIWNDVANSSPLQSIERTLNFGFFDYAMMCNSYLTEMQHLFSQCQQMMNVTDEEIQAYSKKRQQMEDDMKEADTASASKQQKLMQLQNEITKAKKNKQ
jgi:hypothetical protein